MSVKIYLSGQHFQFMKFKNKAARIITSSQAARENFPKQRDRGHMTEDR